jgi:hypothetical protein
MAVERRRETRSFQEMAYLNTLKLNALVELLNEKGILNKREFSDKVNKLQVELQAKRKAN